MVGVRPVRRGSDPRDRADERAVHNVRDDVQDNVLRP